LKFKKIELAKLGPIIQAHQIQNIQLKVPSVDLVTAVGKEYQGRLNNRNVMITVYPTREQLQRQVAILNKPDRVRDPHVVDYLGCFCFGEQLGHDSAVVVAAVGSFPNAIVTERGSLGSLVDYMTAANKSLLPELHA